MVSKFKVRLKSLLQQSLSETECYFDSVYKLKKMSSTDGFSDQFRIVIIRYKRIGYTLYVMRQSACLAVNPIAVNSFAFSN